MKEPKRRRIWSYSMIVGLELLVIGIVVFLWARNVLTPTDTLAYFLLGIGVIELLDVVARYLKLAPLRFMWCRIMLAFVLLSSGGAVLGGIGDWWPLILILVGVGILVNALLSFVKKGE
jgi:hypothetical protein